MTLLIRREPDAISETWAFSTETHKAISGKERRIANRRAPLQRLSLEYKILGDAEYTDPELAELRAALFVDPISAIEIPLRIDGRPTTNAIAGTTVNLDATYADWIAVDQAVYVEGQTADDFYTSTISVVGGTVGARVLTLNDSPPGGMSFPAGVTTISPIATLLPDDRRPLARFQADHGQLQISGVVSNTWAAYGTGATLTTYGGVPVLDERPVTDSDLFEEQFGGDLERIESLPGAVAQTWNRDRAEIARLHTFNAEGEGERQWWRKFLTTVVGKQKAFLLPTWRADLTLVDVDGDHITVACPPTVGAIDYLNDYFPSLAHQTIGFVLSDGTLELRTVESVEDQLDGTALITFTAAVDDMGDIFEATICLVELCRLGADEITFVRGSTAIDLEVPCVVVQQATEGALSTHADYERSVQASSPIEFVKITGAGVAYYMTGERAAVSYGGHSYVSTPGLSRASLERTGQESPRELELQLPMSSTFAAEQAFNPSEDLEVTVYRQNAGGTVVWSPPSPISSLRIRGSMLVLRAPSLLDDPLRGNIPSVHYQGKICNHRLFSAPCRRPRAGGSPAIDPADFDLSTTLATVSGRTITVASVGAFADGDLVGGVITHGPTGTKKMVVSNVGATLVLASAGRGWIATDAVTLLRACDKTIETCAAVFDNVINFGGHPYIPRTNIFDSLVSNPEL